MSRFYLLVWAGWALRLTLSSISLALILASFISMYLYIAQGMPPLIQELQEALIDITLFWFPIIWSLTLLLFLFRTLKFVFNKPINNYKLQLLSCPKEEKVEVIEDVGFGDLVQVWRKWFMLIIWLVGAQMIIALIFSYILNSYIAVFDWFNIYVLYGFVLVAGYFSFMILNSRCKRVRLVKC
ncbi:MAG: hypothetical protein Q9M40_12280 [Sulfurimonas sp.]|nr:hypothetical protein [Sulfurimonas sp.]